MKLVAAPEVAHVALSPLRRRILALVDEPLAASDLAQRLGLTRQRVNYHLGILEKHGLVEVAETKQKRGFVERRFRRVGPTVLAPDMLVGDDLAADAVVAAASDAIRAVGETEADGKPHPTATLVTEVRFATPADHQAFLEAVGDLAAKYDAGDTPGALAMKVTVLSHIAKGVKR